MKKCHVSMRREGFLGAFVALLLALVPSVALADSLYRCYNPSTGEHLYTTHAEEVAHLEAYGWNWENQQTMTLPSSGTPVWRLVNTANDDHHYTSDAYEAQVLTTQRGWRFDFDGQPAFYSAGSDQQSVYRIYNTGAPRFGHLFTLDGNERNFWLNAGGWNDEGVAWYAFGRVESNPSEIPPEVIITPSEPSAPSNNGGSGGGSGSSSSTDGSTVYVTASGKGKVYHSTPGCRSLRRSRAVAISLAEAQSQGLYACPNCH